MARQEDTTALTAGEWRVLRILVTGASNQQMAEVLSVTIHTVIKYLSNIYQKIGACRREQAIRWYEDQLKRERQHEGGSTT